MKSKRTRIIIAASAATLLVAGLITFFVWKNKHKLATYEVSFALPETASEEERNTTKLPETVKVQEGTTIGTLAKPTRDGAIFMSWTYDPQGLNRANSDDPITSNLVLFPRFVKEQGLNDITGFTYVSKTNVPGDFDVELVTYGLSREQVEALVSVKNASRAGVDVPYVLYSESEAEAREWLSTTGLNGNTVEAVLACIDKSKNATGDSLADLLKELAADPPEGVEFIEDRIAEIVYHFSPESVMAVDTEGLNEQTILMIEALGIDFSTVTEADLLELYGLDPDDSLERFWREEIGLEIDQVLLLEKLLYADKNLRGDHWKLHYAYGEWEGGEAYSVNLSNTARIRFLYDGEPTAKEVTDYNITIVQEEITNMTVDSRVIHVPASEVEGVDFRGVLTLETDENGNMTAKENTGTGVLTYSGSEVFEPGTTVAVHKGDFTDDGLSSGDVAYVKIILGYGDGRYDFEYAGLESILASENVIPVPDDGFIADGKITVDDKNLDFSRGIFRDYGLSADTVIKAGDKLIFYTGKLGGDDYVETGYGTIAGITKENNKTTFSYSLLSREELTAPEIVLYNTLPEIDFETSEVDLNSVEQEMYDQISKSTIMDETKELFEMLLTDQDIDFDDFEHGDELRNMVIKTNGEDMTLEDIRKLSSGGGKVKVEDWQFNFTGGFILQYLEGKGLRAEVSVSFKITIQIGDNGGVLEIVPAVIFEQEIKLTPTIKVKRNKNKWGLTSSLDITASLDAGTYTGFGVVVTAQTKNEEKPDADFAEMTGGFIDNGNASDLPGRTSAAKALIMAGDGFTAYTNLEKMKNKGAGYSGGSGGLEAQESQEGVSPGLGGGLVEKYSNMLGNDSEYIKLVSVDVASIDIPIDPCGIIHVGMKVNFNVSLKINAMIGAGISYENEKLYSYAFRAKIWGGGDEYHQIGGFKEGSSVTDIKTSCFRADFYAFGMIGLRAGVSLDLRVGVFSTDLDSVGIVASAGVYAELYGFLYVHYELKAGQPAKSGACGSLYFEVGIYTDISVMLQVGAGRASKSWSLYNSRLPFLKLGCEFFPIDFVIEPNDEKLTVKIQSTTNTAKIDGSIFKMKLMALQTGKEKEEDCDSKKVDTSDGTSCTATIIQPESETNGLTLSTSRSWTQYNEENFTVECFDTDDKGNILPGASSFQYLPGTNEVVIIPIDCTKTKFYGKIVFTYKNHAFGFNTEKIQRTVNVSWEGTLKTARVEFYREVTTLGAFELVGTGSVTGLENTYCYVAITPEFANLYPGYMLDRMAYPDEAEIKKKRDEKVAEFLAVQDARRKVDPRSQEAQDLYNEWKRLGAEKDYLWALYNSYTKTNEEAVANRNGGNTYFTLRGNDTVVAAYFRRYQVYSAIMLYDSQYDYHKSLDYSSVVTEILDAHKIFDSIPESYKNFRPELYESVNWYIKYTDHEQANRYGSGAMYNDSGAIQNQVRNGDLSGLTPINKDTVMEKEKGSYSVIVGIPVGKTHTIHWMDDETEIATTTQHYLEKIVPPKESPSKAGCIFEGWETDYGKLNSDAIMRNDDMYITASFKGDDVNVTWITDDGRKIESVIHVNDRIYQSVPEELQLADGSMIIWRTDQDDMSSTVPYDYKMDNRSEVTFYGRTGIGFSRLTWIDGDYENTEYVEIGVAPKRPERTGAGDLTWLLADGSAMQKEFIMPRSSVTATAYWHNHNWSDELARVNPTCKSTGHEGVVCKECGLIADGTTLPMDPNAHVWADYVITPSTCTVEGVMGHQCDYCTAIQQGYTEAIAINPFNHVHLERRNERLPSCKIGYSGDIYCADCDELVEEGYETYITGRCVYGMQVDRVNATCTEWGDPGREVCIYCGRLMKAYSYKYPPTGHWGVVVPEKSKDATCDDDGFLHMKCKNCGYEWDEERSAMGHTYSKEGEVIEKATCQHGEIRRFYCEDCEGYQDVEVSSKLAHHFINGVVLKEATCKEEGLIRYICEYCNLTKEEPIPKTEQHRYPGSVVTKEPTCTEKGVRTYTCEVCGNQFTVDIEMIDHKWDVVGITKEPTCKEKGIRQEKCITCGQTRDIELELNPTNHANLGDLEVVQAATCVSEGINRRTCKDCGATVTEKTPALGHDWSEPTYEWTADYSSVTATRACKRDHNHDVKETVRTTAQVTKQPTATTMGETTYTATFSNMAFTTQTRTVANIDKVDESWGTPTYTWSSDNKTVTAKRVRNADSSIVETETVETKAEERKKVSCEEDGETVYTAEFKNAAFSKQTKSVTVPKTGHKWETVSSTEPEMVLNERGECEKWKHGTKHVKCANCQQEKDEIVKVSLYITYFEHYIFDEVGGNLVCDMNAFLEHRGYESMDDFGDTTFRQMLMYESEPADLRAATYTADTYGWWLNEGSETFNKLNLCFPNGSWSISAPDGWMDKKVKDYTGKSLTITITFSATDSDTFITPVTRTAIINFP